MQKLWRTKRQELQVRGLIECSNIFFIQRYGKYEGKEEYDLPFIVANPMDFYLYSPDGQNFGQELVRRSKHMEELS